MTRLALLRHGPTDWNRNGRLQGRTDRPLTQEARADLAALRLPAPWSSAAIHASPLARARDTATILAGTPPRIEPALTEMNWGAWEGQRGADLAADTASGFRDIEHWGWAFRPSGGESPAEVLARLRPWLAGLTADTLAVTHIGVMRVLLAWAHEWDFDGPAPFRIKRNRLYLLDLGASRPRPLDPPVRLEARV